VGLIGGQPTQVDPGDAFEAPEVGRFAHGDDRRNVFGAEPAAHERQCHRRLFVDPLRVLDDDEQGLSPGCLGDEAQEGEADQERVESLMVGVAEHAVERRSLWSWELLHRVVQQQDELVDSRVPEWHLRLDADDACDAEAGCLFDREPHERRLPDASRARDQKCARHPASGVGEERVDLGQLGGSADERRVRRQRSSGIVRIGHDSPPSPSS
jgi:hypothetical protein